MSSRWKHDKPMSRTAFDRRFPDEAACARHMASPAASYSDRFRHPAQLDHPIAPCLDAAVRGPNGLNGSSMSKKQNRDQKRGKKIGELRAFVQQYARKAYPNYDPNDRRYDRKVEKVVKRMPPDILDQLLHGDDEE